MQLVIWSLRANSFNSSGWFMASAITAFDAFDVWLLFFDILWLTVTVLKFNQEKKD